MFFGELCHYTVDNILAGADIKNFKALQDFVNKLDQGELDSLTKAVSKLTDYVDTETARAKQAEKDNAKSVSDEIANAKVREGQVQQSVSDEVDRAKYQEGVLDAAINTEKSRAKLSESLITQKKIISTSLLPSVTVIGGQSLPLLIPSSIYTPFDGWYYNNLDPSSSINKK